MWLLLLGLAVLNGGARNAGISPWAGEFAGRVISTLTLCALIAVATRATIAWIRPPTTRAALGVGCLWLGLTEAFEFGAGHYLFGKPWEQFLADYDLSQGRIWIAVLVVTLLAPLWAARVRGLVSASVPPVR